MEMAGGGSLTSYVADKWQKAQALGLFLSEDEARYFFKVGAGGVQGGWVGGWGQGGREGGSVYRYGMYR